jgi:hypothetical protein
MKGDPGPVVQIGDEIRSGSSRQDHGRQKEEADEAGCAGVPMILFVKHEISIPLCGCVVVS